MDLDKKLSLQNLLIKKVEVVATGINNISSSSGDKDSSEAIHNLMKAIEILNKF